MLNDPELSREYKIRAITRDVNSKKAKELKEKVEVVTGDAFNRASIEEALAGSHTVFVMTAYCFKVNGVEIEYNNAKTIADVAVEKGAEYIIFSTLPSLREISGGKYTKAIPFEAKAKAEQYIRSLPIKSAFFSAGSFMENFQFPAFLGARKSPDGTWKFSRNNSPTTKLALLDAVGDTGKFVGAILAEPEKYEGKTFYGATKAYSLEEIASILSKATSETIVYKQIPLAEFKEALSLSIKDDLMVSNSIEVFNFMEEFGCFGRHDSEVISWAVKNARGRVSTFEEFLVAHPYRLE